MPSCLSRPARLFSALVLLASGAALLPSPCIADEAPAASPSAAATPAPEGMAAFDTLPGNGVAYTLSHGGVLAKTLSVRASGRPLQAGRDYLFNPSTGSLTLVEPPPAGATLTVRYRYKPESDTQKNPFQFSFAPGFSGGLKLNAFSASSSGGTLGFSGSGTQVSGLMLESKSLGSGKLSGMTLLSRKGDSPLAAFAHPRDGRASLLSQLAGGAAPKAVSDELHQYQVDGIKAGSGTFGVSYRKVGKDFDFSPVASQFKDGPQKAMMDLLQKEKGLQTLGFTGNYGFSAGLRSNMGFTQISDEKGTATQQSVSLNGKLFDVTYDALKVNSGFAHLKESALQNVGDLAAGQERKNLVATLHPSTKMTLQTTMTKLTGEKGDSKSVQGQSLQLKPGKNTNLAFSRQQAITRLDGTATSAKKEMRQTLAFDHQTKGGIILQAKQDTLQITDGDTKTSQRSTLFHLETDPKKSTIFLFEKKSDKNSGGTGQESRKMKFAGHIARIATVQWSDDSLRIQETAQLRTVYEKKLRIETDAKKPINFLFNSEASKKDDGATKAIQQIVFGAQLSPAVMLKDTDTVQQDGTKTVTGNNLEFTVKPAPKVEVGGNLLNRDESDRGGTDEMNLNLKAQAGTVELVAEHHEAEVQSDKVDRQINAVSVAAPVGGDSAKLKGMVLTQENKGIHEKRCSRWGMSEGWWVAGCYWNWAT